MSERQRIEVNDDVRCYYYDMKLLAATEFGNPLLRKKARKLSISEIKSANIQNLIKNMRYTLMSKKMGVGIAAPQVGKSISLAVIAIHPTAHRPKVKAFDQVIINPKIQAKSSLKPRWEGCLSAGKIPLFAKVPRFTKITLKYLDENGLEQTKPFRGLPAQVIQHEIDHLNGVLFVDRVKDTKTYMTLAEYKKRVVANRKKIKSTI